MKGYPSRVADDEDRAHPLLDYAAIAKLVEDYIPLVLRQVDRMWLSPRIGLTRDDLVSAGCYGLLLAARRFDPSRGVGFGVFARSHVRGALIREIDAALKAAGAGREDVLIAVQDDVEPDSLPDQSAAAEVDSAESAEVRELMEYVLTEQERLVLTLYYFEELTLAETAAVVETSEIAVARTIKGALAKLKAAMAEKKEHE